MQMIPHKGTEALHFCKAWDVWAWRDALFHVGFRGGDVELEK